MTVMGTPNSTIECSFRKKGTGELITVSLTRDTKGGGLQSQSQSQQTENRPPLPEKTPAAVDPIPSMQPAQVPIPSMQPAQVPRCVLQICASSCTSLKQGERATSHPVNEGFEQTAFRARKTTCLSRAHLGAARKAVDVRRARLSGLPTRALGSAPISRNPKPCQMLLKSSELRPTVPSICANLCPLEVFFFKSPSRGTCGNMTATATLTLGCFADYIVAIDGESVSGKSLSQLAQTVMGVPNTTIECSFKRRENQELITVSLVRGVKPA